MVVTLKGYQGTIADTDMATMFLTSPGVTATPTDLAVTAVAGNRQVSVAPGTAVAHFQKYTSDAAQTITLNPPASGGKWYLVAINRQWAPASTAVLEAIDTGITTDGTTRTMAPVPSSLAAAGIRNNPGTGNTSTPPAVGYGHHQPLAWVHVRAADTTLQVFGCSLAVGTAGQVFMNGTIQGLQLHALYRTPLLGQLVPVLGDGITWRWDGVSAWKQWDSDWMGWTYGAANLAFGSASMKYRWRAGLVRCKMYLSGTVNIGSGIVTMSLPIPALTDNLHKPAGRVVALDSGQAFYALFPDFVDPNNIKFWFEYSTGTGPVQEREMTTALPVGWNTGDLLYGSFEYEAA